MKVLIACEESQTVAVQPDHPAVYVRGRVAEDDVPVVKKSAAAVCNGYCSSHWEVG